MFEIKTHTETRFSWPTEHVESRKIEKERDGKREGKTKGERDGERGEEKGRVGKHTEWGRERHSETTSHLA